MRTDIANVTEPTFAELAHLADALWNEQRYAAAAGIFLQAADVARKQRRYTKEAMALLFADRAQEQAQKAAA